MNPDYGRCHDCGISLATEDDARAHMSATVVPVTDDKFPSVTHRGHSVRVLNPPRSSRVRNHVGLAIQDAVNDCVEELWRDVESGKYTASEIRDGLAGFDGGFIDAWDELAAEATS